MPLRKRFRRVMQVWKAIRTNPKLRWAYARIRTSRENRGALQFLTAKLRVPPENVRAMYVRMRNTLNRKSAVGETVNVLREIDQLAEALNLHATPWLKDNLKQRKPEELLEDLRQQAQQQGLAAA